MDHDQHDSTLIAYLEPDQLVLDKSRPVSRIRLNRPMAIGLWALRIGVTVLGGLVLYTFVAQLS